MSAPLISVVLPFRDPGPYLAPAIESMLSQTFTDFELIAIDDGSRDGSAEVVASYARRDPRVRPVVQEGLGLVATLNSSLKLARAPIIGRMDGDDISLPDRLERQVAFMERNPDVAVLGTAYRVFVGDRMSRRVTEFPSRPEEIRERLLTKNMLGHPTTLMRRGALEAVGGYRTQFKDAEDHDLWLRLSERVDIANLPDVLYLYRWHATQTTFNRLEQQASSSLAAIECARRRRGGLPDPSADRERPVDIEFLVALGLDREVVAAQIAEISLDAVRALIEVDLVAQAEQVARALDARQRSGALGGREAFAAARLAWWHVHRARGRRLDALGELGRCVGGAPVPLAGRLARRLRRLASPRESAR